MTDEQAAFGSELRRERERRKISLASLSDITKINRSLLAAFERGDATRWPKGIYRRAFFRAYSVAIGLPAESNLSEFMRLFPEGGATGSPPSDLLDAASTLRLTLAPQRHWTAFIPLFPEGGATSAPQHDLLDAASSLRLTLVPQRYWSARSLRLHVCVALLDGSAVFAVTIAAEMFTHVERWTALGLAAIAYYSVATICLGCSPGSWLVNTLLLRPPKLPHGLLHFVQTPRQSTPTLVEGSR